MKKLYEGLVYTGAVMALFVAVGFLAAVLYAPLRIGWLTALDLLQRMGLYQ